MMHSFLLWKYYVWSITLFFGTLLNLERVQVNCGKLFETEYVASHWIWTFLILSELNVTIFKPFCHRTSYSSLKLLVIPVVAMVDDDLDVYELDMIGPSNHSRRSHHGFETEGGHAVRCQQQWWQDIKCHSNYFLFSKSLTVCLDLNDNFQLIWQNPASLCELWFQSVIV